MNINKRTINQILHVTLNSVIGVGTQVSAIYMINYIHDFFKPKTLESLYLSHIEDDNYCCTMFTCLIDMKPSEWNRQ